MRASILSPALLATLACAATAQSTWYVDANAPGPGSGSLLDPFSRIQPALSASADGDTILVGPGQYEENLSIVRRVTLRSLEGPLTTSIAPSNPNEFTIRSWACCAVPRTSVEGFTVYGAAGFRGEFADARRCLFIGPGSGLGATTGYDVTLEHCTVYGYDLGAGAVLHGARVNVKNTLLHGNLLDLSELISISHSWWTSYSSGGPFTFSGLGSPGLFDAPGHDFHLALGSGCIDAGDPTSPPDPDGSRADIGALPFDPTYAPFMAYCTAKVNSLGCTPAIGAVNNASLSSSRPFWITCVNELNQRSGLLFYGFSPQATPYQGGYLCVHAPVRRTGLIDSGGSVGVNDCSGVYSFDFNAILQSGSDPQLAPGAEVFCQFWSRDPAASFFVNRSDALRFGIQP